MGRRAKSVKAKGEAKPSVAPESGKDDLRVRDLEKRLAEALTQQTATSEVLKVISRSTFDLQPVLQTLIEHATRLCDAQQGFIYRSDGEIHQLAVDFNAPPAFTEWSQQRATRPGDGSVVGRVAQEKRVVQILDAQADAEWRARTAHAPGITDVRTLLGVPMLRDGVVIGVFAMWRSEIRPFTDKQIDLVMTFADQAVIAIENVRLFNETKEALEQQTATADILRVISSSPTDIQPVLDTIVRNAARVCAAFDAILVLADGDAFVQRAHHGPIAAPAPAARYPLQGTVSGRVILEARVIQVENLAEARDYPIGRDLARRMGYRTTLSVPLLRGGAAIGAIGIRRTEVLPFSDEQIALLKTFADQAVIAIENVRLFTELQQKNQALTEAHAQVTESLERQTATSDILRVIASSPTDAQPVFETILANAVRLCDAKLGQLCLRDGENLRWVASHGATAAIDKLVRGTVFKAPAQALRPHGPWRPLQIPDLRETEPYRQGWPSWREQVDVEGARTVVAVPLVKVNQYLGSIFVYRREVLPFTEVQVALLGTFADQAVIAIENVRLFNETKEALDRQTATSEILRVISSSPTDVQPVLVAVAESAARLCGAFDATIFHREGDRLRLVAHHGPMAIPGPPGEGIVPLVRGTVSGRSVLDGQTVHVADLQLEADEFPEGREFARRLGHRTNLCVPLMQKGIAIGTINLRRTEARPFTDAQVNLVETFADQAVIAIENVRLFTELQASNRELTTALDTQTATSDILRVISRSQTDVQPVFDAIVTSAVRLLGAYSGTLTKIAGDQIELAALTSTDAGGDAALRALFPIPLELRQGSHTQAIRSRAPFNVADAHSDPRLREDAWAYARVRGYRSQVVVPMLLHDEAIGTISVSRREPGGFTDDEIALLKTFADQAVIAIENVRLFKELQARTQELTRSVDQLTALGEVGRAVSSSLDLETVLTTIVSRAVELSGLDGGVVFEYDDRAEEFVHRVATDAGGALAELRRATRVRKGEGVVGQTALTLEPACVLDISVPGAYESRLRDNLIESGVRAILAVPMVREGQLIGCLVVSRNRPGDFPVETIELLRTFATQSALAIQNARLFRELADKSHQLEIASQHKSEFLANMSHELRTPLNAIIGFSEVLSDRMFGELNEKQEEYLKDINASGTHLLSLINDILDLSKIEAGRMELELTEFDLPNAIENALMLVRERAGRRSIELHTSIDSRLGQIQADERKVRQVVLNLLSNAIKFTPEGGGIEVGAAPKDGFVEMSVRDTGIGIAPEDQEKVFEEFRQVGTAAKKVEGTGLGLTLCRKFVELHGGRIWVKSELGQGSTFTFTIPVRRGE